MAIQSCDWKRPSWTSTKTKYRKNHLQLCSGCFFWVWNLKFQSKHARTWNSKPSKTEKFGPKGKLRCTCRQGFVGWTNLSYGKWLGAPLSPCVWKGRRKWIISLSPSSFNHSFGAEMTQNLKKFTCLQFYREILKMMGRMENAFVIFQNLWPSIFRKVYITPLKKMFFNSTENIIQLTILSFQGRYLEDGPPI